MKSLYRLILEAVAAGADARSLVEWTAQDTVNNLHPKVVQRMYNVVPTLAEVWPRRGLLVFHVTSETTPGQDHWVVQVLVPALMTMKNPTLGEVAKALQGPLKARCQCPAFSYYGSKWGLLTKRALYGRPGIAYRPRERPYRGPACKHLAIVSKVLPFHAARIRAAILKGRPYRG